MLEERERIERVYAAYDSDPREQAKRSPANPGTAYILRERRRVLERTLSDEEVLPLRGKSVLDLGCGFGDDLALLQDLGAAADLCHGVDILPSRIAEARARHPQLNFSCSDARELPYHDDAFDVVFTSVIFSSILDWVLACAAADEIVRVLNRRGVVVWYDSRYPNPWNANVRRYSKRHLRRLFPGFEMSVRTLTLLPPLARIVGRSAPRLLPVLSSIPLLRARYLAVLRPYAGSAL